VVKLLALGFWLSAFELFSLIVGRWLAVPAGGDARRSIDNFAAARSLAGKFL
jgi:hypothetical protein